MPVKQPAQPLSWPDRQNHWFIFLILVLVIFSNSYSNTNMYMYWGIFDILNLTIILIFINIIMKTGQTIAAAWFSWEYSTAHFKNELFVSVIFRDMMRGLI